MLSAKTLDALRGQKAFDMVELNNSTAYVKDKRDIWTLQRVLAEESRQKHEAMAKELRDSGRGSLNSKRLGAFKLLDKFPSLRGSLTGRPKKKRPKVKIPSQTLEPVNLGMSGEYNYKL